MKKIKYISDLALCLHLLVSPAGQNALQSCLIGTGWIQYDDRLAGGMIVELN